MLLLAAALLTAGGCGEKIETPKEIVATFSEAFTRVSYTQQGIKFKAAWDPSDKIVLKDSEGTAGSTCTITDASRTEEGHFTIPENMGNPPYFAFYPESIANKRLPATQAYKQDGPAEAPMYARSSDFNLAFSPLCGVLEVKLSSDAGEIAVSSLTLDAAQPLSGQFNISTSGAAIISGGGGNITMYCGGMKVGSTPKSFYFNVPENAYTGIGVTVTTTDGRSKTLNLKSGVTVAVVRAELTTCPMTIGSLDGDQVEQTAILPRGDLFNRMLKVVSGSGTTQDATMADEIDSTIISIKFLAGQVESSGTRIDDGASVVPIHASFDAGSGTMTISTTASKFKLNPFCGSMFRGLAALRSFSFSGLDSEGVSDISYMFSDCHDLCEIDLTDFRSEAVEKMDNTFSDCHKLSVLDMSKFRSDRVTDLRSCFNRCYCLTELDLRGLGTSNCTRMTYTFHHCIALRSLDLSGFDLSNVVGSSLNYCFYCTPSLGTLKLGPKFISSDNARPSSFFTGSGLAQESRTGNYAGGITIHCTQAVANWLATTNLRWIHSGYKGMTAISVTFLDIDNGSTLSVKWSAN